MVKITLVLVVFLCEFNGAQSYCTAGDTHFFGGSLSYKFIDTTSDDAYKMRLTSVTGWKIGQGPCGQICTSKDIGFSTTLNRRHILDLNGDMYFGNWTEEVGRRLLNGSSTKYYSTINSNVSESWTGVVAAVNEKNGWEQEFAEIDLNIDPKSLYTDIAFEGCYWRSFTYGSKYTQMEQAPFHLQTKVKTLKRNDTRLPNTSPVAMFKPLYKVLLNKKTIIKLSTMDEDGDYVVCEYATFVRAGGLKTLKNTNVSKDCTVTIFPDEAAGFVDGGFGAIPILVGDHSTSPTSMENGEIYLPNELFGSITVQLMIQTLKTIQAPEFVQPTKDSQHEFNVYVGSEIRLTLFAKPNNISHMIDNFHLRSIPSSNFVVSDLQTDPTRRDLGVKYAHATWRPQEKDVGMYVLGALVTDSTGSDGLDRNYKIVVKEPKYLKADTFPKEGPYFPYFPYNSSIRCAKEATCIFPIYSRSRHLSATIRGVNGSTSPYHVINIETPVPVKKDGDDMFVSDVSFTASVGGDLTFCFHAEDSKGLISQIECIQIQIMLPDPCWNQHCPLRGHCVSKGENFTCECLRGFTGELCETGIDYCTQNTCSAGSTCFSYPFISGRAVCKCAPGTTGSRCEVDIPDCKPDSCNHHGTCLDKLNTYTCQCYKGYTGQHCETVDPLCSNHHCNNHGICTVESSVATCICPLGFTGDHCQEIELTANNTDQAQFIIPTPVSGTEIQCELGQPCHIPLFISWTNQGKLPRFPIFLKSSEIYGSLSALTPDSYIRLRNSLKFVLTVLPSIPGSGDVCVMTGEGTQSHSVCYRLHIRPGQDTPSASKFKKPPMVSPTLPNNSSVTCIKGQPCHIVFTSEVDPTSKDCRVMSLSPSAIVFPMDSNGNECRSDVLFLPPPQGDNNVCFRAGNCKDQCLRYQGEERCYDVNISAKDFCSPNPCSEGSCILKPGTTSGFRCI